MSHHKQYTHPHKSFSLSLSKHNSPPPSLCNHFFPLPFFLDFNQPKYQTPLPLSRFLRSLNHHLCFLLCLLLRSKVIYVKRHQLNICALVPKFGSSMVSLRRRRLLGLCSGRSSFLSPIPWNSDNGIAPENISQNAKPVSMHPLLSFDISQPQWKSVAKVGPGSSSASGASSPEQQNNQPKEQFIDKPLNAQTFSGLPIKRRKRHRRKQIQNQEPCLMRGVYFKNMKWQAAIKVDKKQIHLGTVGSQEEAARLYDRAAFMCGREPNFELSEEEKQELMKFKWEEFLAYTRRSITNKKYKRRIGAGSYKRPEYPPLENSDRDNKQAVSSFSASEEAGPDSSGS